MVFSIPLWWLVFKPFFYLAIAAFALYTLLNFIDSTLKNKSIQVGLLSIIAVYVQLVGYGVGFITEGWKKLFEEKGYKQLGDNIEYPS